MMFIAPQEHMISRVTDDHEAMAKAGVENHSDKHT